MAPLWIAQEGKVFARNGLDVEVLYLESALVQRALIAGEISFGEMTGALLSAPRLQGADVVMVLGFVDRLLFRLVARPRFKTAADLKGKRIGTSRYGAALDRAARLVLPKLGVNPDKDVIFRADRQRGDFADGAAGGRRRRDVVAAASLQEPSMPA